MGQWTVPKSDWFWTVRTVRRTNSRRPALLQQYYVLYLLKLLTSLPVILTYFLFFLFVILRVLEIFFNWKISVLYLYQSAAYGSPKLLACILWGFGTKGANHAHGREPARRMAVDFSTPTNATCTVCHSARHKRHFQWTKSIQHCMEMQI